jgi:predicted DNA-binding transcriptional regulator YafY
MAADYSRIHRLLKILLLIQGQKGWTSRRLAEECGTTPRTIFRDMKMLEAAGVPYFYDEQEQCYSLRRDFFLPPVQLTLDETLALAALAEQIGGDEQVPFTKAASRAIAKIRGQLPSALRRQLEQIEDHVSIKLAAASPPEAAADVYELVRRALAARTRLRCQYESLNHAGGAENIFAFDPFTLLFNQRAWYVIGRHGGHDEIRCLKLNRFTRIEPTDQTYAIPKSFSLKRHLGHAWRMIRGKKKHKVELVFDPEFAETIADTQWHPTQEVIWNDDQSITFRCIVEGLNEIVWWILGMGPHCIVKKPEELAQRVRDLAAGIVQKYQPPANSSQPVTHRRQRR